MKINHLLIGGRGGNILIMSALALIGSCQKIDTEIMPQAEQRQLMIEVTKEESTKAQITATSFSSGDEIGIQITDGSGTYNGTNYKNIMYSVNSSKEWNTNTNVSLGSTEGTLYGYYPYSSSVTDLTSVPVSVSSQTDYMYAVPVSGITSENPSASLTMKHALAVVALNIRMAVYNTSADMSSLTISSQGIAKEAVLNSTTGTFSEYTGIGEEIEYSYTAAKRILGQNDCVYSLLVIPTGVSDEITVKMTLDGKVKTISSAPILLESGTNNKIEIVIDDNTNSIIPTAAIGIRHKDGTIYSADGWLTAEASGTVSDSDALGIYVRATTETPIIECPHIIHPKYSENTKWASTTYINPVFVPRTVNSQQFDNKTGNSNTLRLLTQTNTTAAHTAAEFIWPDGETGGYLPTITEMRAWSQNIEEINECLAAIGGDPISYDTQIYSGENASNNRVWIYYQNIFQSVPFQAGGYIRVVRPIHY